MDSNVLPAGGDAQYPMNDPSTQSKSSTAAPVLPPVTFPTDEASLQRAAEIISAANAADPLNTLLSLEEHNASTSNSTKSATPTTETNLYTVRSLRRLRSKLAAGCILAESASFAAVASMRFTGLPHQSNANIILSLRASDRCRSPLHPSPAYVYRRNATPAPHRVYSVNQRP